MKKVVDKSYLRKDDLRRFLSRSMQNKAVIMDFLAWEAYTGDPLVNSFESMKILSEYPQQVIVLKPSIDIARLSGASKGLQRRIIDHPQTKNFPDFCRRLEAAHRGDPAMTQDIIDKGRTAFANRQQVLSDTKYWRSGIKHFEKVLTPAELKIIQNGRKWSRSLAMKIVEFSMGLAVYLVAENPKWKALPHPNELPGTYLFRFALAITVATVWWVGARGSETVKDEKLRNDMIDITYVVYASYFDGLLTFDGKQEQIYNSTIELLSYAKAGMNRC